MRDPDEPFGITDADGVYTITSIDPGTWNVREELQDGWTNSFPVGGAHLVDFVSGATVTDLDFGNWRPATIVESVKFEDLNGNNQRDAGEPGLAGWTIFVDYNGDGLLDPDEPIGVTGADGVYTIIGITPGTWNVREELQGGWTNSFPFDGFYSVDFVSGATVTDLDFGNWLPATIAESVKFEDLNGNNQRDPGEPGLPDWTIFVDYNGDGLRDPDEPFGITDTDGGYTITDIDPGTWNVREELQAGWTNSFPVGGSHLVDFVSGATVIDLDFGNWEPATIAESVKFEDLNGNNQRDAGEPGLPDWTIFVDYDGDGLRDPDEPFGITDTDGDYTITDIDPGTWNVREELQAGWTNSFPVGGSHLVDFVSGATVTDLDFGNWEPATIAESVKFEDLNGNNQRDAGEPGLAGWTIFVDYDDDGLRDPDEPIGVTGADGVYTITNIDPGTWNVREELQAGWTNSFPVGGSHLVDFASGATVTDLDFGNWLPAQLIQFVTPMSVYRLDGPFARPPDFQIAMAGYVWHCQDGDSDWNPGEPGINGVTVYVDVNGNGSLDLAVDVSFTTVNDGLHDGAFWFEQTQFIGLPSGDYSLRVDLPAGQEPLFPGTPDFAHSVTIEEDMSVFGDFEQTQTPNFGIADDFVNEPPDSVATIHGYKWHDVNQDGDWDDDEQGRAGWRVYLDLNEDNNRDPQTEPRTITGADGSYVFANLSPGSYIIREDRFGLSDGTFSVQRFPDADPANRDPDEHQVTVLGGQVLEGRPGIAEEPNFGTFEYSPFVRPADDLVGHLDLNWDGVIDLDERAANADLLTALEMQGWHEFNVANDTEADFEITDIERNISNAPSIDVANEFVSVFMREADGTLVRVVPPIEPTVLPMSVAPGQVVEFVAFYDPAIRNRDEHTVDEQYPDWFDDPDTAVNEQQTRPAHTFVPGDHLNVVTDSSLSFRVDLVGGSTYDSDIFYDGAADRLDLQQLDDLLQLAWPIEAGHPRFDPTSDINARHPDGTTGVMNTRSWPIDGEPPRQLGLEDFGPLNVEFSRSRAPLLDLDSDNSSGVFGTDFMAEHTGDPIGIVDYDAAFANSIERVLASMSVVVVNESTGDELLFDETLLPTDVSVTGNGTSRLQFIGEALVSDYTEWLRAIRYTNAATAAATVTVEIQAVGAVPLFTRLVDDSEVEGNIATATILVRPGADATSSESPAIALAQSAVAATIALAESSHPQATATDDSSRIATPRNALAETACTTDELSPSTTPSTTLVSSEPKSELPGLSASEVPVSAEAAVVDELLADDYTFKAEPDTEYPPDLLALAAVWNADSDDQEETSSDFEPTDDLVLLTLLRMEE